MTKTFCDKCKQEVEDLKAFFTTVKVRFPSALDKDEYHELFDLCETCATKLNDALPISFI